MPPNDIDNVLSLDRDLDRMCSQPERLVNFLEQNDGDTQAFCNAFKNKYKPVVVMAKVYKAFLKSPKEQKKWDEAVACFEQAKISVARRTALEYISDYKPPAQKIKKKVTVDGKKVDVEVDVPDSVSTFTSFTKFWLAGHNAYEVGRARQNAKADEDDEEEEDVYDDSMDKMKNHSL